ncbi:sacsin N-terminal ATP-binding-like domain-containing protein [Streptomyces pristinaespiralis]|uniref:sacsin N-terminal ATP-binding-like domain-containing protein n=1 Tax=Streptomyces pristinaespiralis TaxID=38300 RepID=UPI0033E4E51A
MTGLLDRLAALQKTLVREHEQAPGLFREMARMEGLLADTYRDRVPYELLQNSDDAGATSVVVEGLGGGRFRWSNDGRALDGADVEALCRSASSTKSRGGDSIGYRGIGFKSLAAVASRIEVRSEGVRFAFDRSVAAVLLGEPGVDAVPLIRLPTDIREDSRIDGVAFTVTCRPGAHGEPGVIDPLSTLFLRNVTRIQTHVAGERQDIRIERDASRVVLRLGDDEAAFGLLRHGAATVAVPLDARSLAMTGVRGRLACFLPLEDEVGLPVIVSGDILTDPSRTHAVAADESTRLVLADAARALAERLRTPGDPMFERLWQLVLEGEDLRTVLVSATASIGKLLVAALREEMIARRPLFAHSPLALEPEDVAVIFPDGAPAALYAAGNQAAARALKAVLGLQSIDVSAALAAVDASRLSDELRSRLAEYLRELARTHGRKLTAVESRLVDTTDGHQRANEAAPVAAVRVTRAAPQPAGSLASVLARWRVAELGAMEYLNQLGWELRDVSGQNVGYDLEGVDPQGRAVRVEVKKVDRPDARFAMTNNEMSLMLTKPGGYLLAIIVGDGRHAKLMMLDPSRDDLPKERVCRRWDWEFTDWSRFAEIAEIAEIAEGV